MKKHCNPFAALVLGIGLAFSPLARATLVLADGTVFYGFVTGSDKDYRLTLRMDFTATQAGSQFMGDNIEAWSLQLPGAATSSLVSAPTDSSWSVYNTGKAVGGPNGCSNGNATTVCVDRIDNSRLHGSGPQVSNTFFDWEIDIDFAAAQSFTSGGNFHLLTIRQDKNGDWKKDSDLISVNLGQLLLCEPSASGGGCIRRTPPEEVPSVPEPGTLALIGLGAMLARGLRRRKGKPG